MRDRKWRPAVLGLGAAVVLAVGGAVPAAASPEAELGTASSPGLAVIATGPMVAFSGAGLAPDSVVTLVVRSPGLAVRRTLAVQTDGAGGLRTAALLCSRVAHLPLEVTATDEAGGAASAAFAAPAC